MADSPTLLALAQSDPQLDKALYEARETVLRTALLNAQYDQLAKAKRSLLIVVSGIDGSGKGATINLLNEWMDPRHIRTLAFDKANASDRIRAPMWRYWNALPEKGKTGIVFGSWYALILREALRKKTRPKRIAKLAADIRRFEAMLAAEGVQIVKLWFQSSKAAQAQRTKHLLASKQTAWQVTPADHKVRQMYERLCAAGERTIEVTHRAHAPWHVVPSADACFRTIRTAEIVLNALTSRAVRIEHEPDAQTQTNTKIVDRLAPTKEAIVEKDDYTDQIGVWQGRLAQAVRSNAFRNKALVLVFEGQDASGKGGAIRRVANALDARQYEINQIAAPTSEELAHPYLWRFWRRLPEQGRVGIFDRSWYGRVLVERVEKFAAPAAWRRAYDEINDFEAQLVDNGAIVLKFWLNVSKDEQLARFEAREQSPFKRFKITPDDWRNREKWNAYSTAANDMFARTDQPHAPWHVIAADDKRHARLNVLKKIVLALEHDD